MPEFLLELLSEEIPARMQAEACAQLKQRFGQLMDTAGLAAETVAAHATPRRLALLVGGLAASSRPVVDERRGPRADAPPGAIAGFLKSTGLARSDLVERDDAKGRFLYAVIERPGRPAAALLAELLPALIEEFSWPKSQRWGAASVSTASPRWVRPLRAIVALLDDQEVPFAALGVPSGRDTAAHRFMGPAAPIRITDAARYATELERGFVRLSAQDRVALIRSESARLAAAAGLRLVPDAELEAENAGLTEWPVPLMGRFDPAFLAVPREIITLSMRTNQKYFALEDETGALAPAFVCVANVAAPDNGATIVAGNERVLSARLSDARFFWQLDLGEPLSAMLTRLADRLFFADMGTMRDKAARNARIAAHLWQWWHGPEGSAQAARAAELAKADLASATVNEFPELQGVIGGYLARAGGEPAEVAAAIAEQYGASPSSLLSVCVGLADRIDTLAAFFAAGRRPTGSRDPFALRRSALHMIEIILRHGRPLALLPLFEQAAAALPMIADGRTPAHVAAEVVGFLVERMQVQQREAGVAADRIAAVAGGEDDLVRLAARVRALDHFLGIEDGANLLAGHDRAVNIVRIEERKDGRTHAATVDIALLREPAEQALHAALEQAGAEARAAAGAGDFERAMRAMAALRPSVDAFFADVTVNDADPLLRSNRLALLAMFRDTAALVADFSRIGC
jgi:glycyl-tRNA synthetase beta chain